MPAPHEINHEDLFGAAEESCWHPTGDLVAGAAEVLQAAEEARALGSRIVVKGPLAETAFGRRILLSRLIDLAVPFDDIE